ncbi:metallophosphoesterase [Candidatus Woesearchaeota archaeon]|nr:metallophosphoesterase [Candidatus Woesearchaeota archaeon]
MEILKGIEIYELTLFIKESKILVLGDLHLGFEESLNKQGIFIPRFQFTGIFSILKRIIDKIRPDKIIIVGDLKHEFGSISEQEWRHVLELIDFLALKSELIIIKGNHDVKLFPITNKRDIKILPYYKHKDILFAHGDVVIEDKSKIIIIGHEHPAVSFKERPTQKYKCFLKGKYGKAELIVMPSLNLVTEGSDITKGRFMSPYLKNSKNIEVYVNEDKAYRFGRLKDIK